MIFGGIFNEFFLIKIQHSKFFFTFCELYLYTGMTKIMCCPPQVNDVLMVRMSAKHKEHPG